MKTLLSSGFFDVIMYLEIRTGVWQSKQTQ